MKFGIGQSVVRKEDKRLVSGQGVFVEDAAPPGALQAAILRSPMAHARIAGIDIDDALAAPGVHAVLTGRDYAGDGIGGLGCHTILPGIHTNAAAPQAPAIGVDRVRYVGAPVAIVLADSRRAARDAAERIFVDYAELPAVITPADALADGAPALWEEAPGNVAFDVRLGDEAAVEAAFAQAAHITRLSVHNNRVSANAMETRGAIASYEASQDKLTLRTSTQSPHAVRGEVARMLGMPQAAIRVVAGDVGGGFGMKGCVYAEEVLVAWAARRLRATVCWQADRSESLLSDYHGRDQWAEGVLALDADGRILALKVTSDYNTGAHLASSGGVPPMFASALATGCYRVPVAYAYSRAVYTNTSPTQPYRGAGRPEASYLIERLIDKAARETDRDPVALRRRNILTPDEMPHETPLLYTIDSGDYPAILDRALEAADWSSFKARRRDARKRGRLRGIGLALHMENAGLANETAEIRFDAGGSVTVIAGTFSHGQGHETVYAQMVSDFLGVPFDSIRFLQGDTDAVSFGRGTVASRSMINGGGALRVAADRVIERGRAIAAHMLETDADDIDFSAGRFVVAGTDKAVSIQQVAATSYMPMLPGDLGLGLFAEGSFQLGGFCFPNGCQIAEVEIDPETGETEVLGITSVDDVGTVVNPMLLEGQMVGGIAQGVGQALLETVVYEPGSGQLVTGSFTDYAMPRAADMPPVDFITHSTPTPTNPLGVKGAGEAGTVGATPAVILAVLDALGPLGVSDIALPATPSRVWEAIRDAG